MPKSQMINPEDVRKPSKVEFKPVPVNQYKKTVRVTAKTIWSASSGI